MRHKILIGIIILLLIPLFAVSCVGSTGSAKPELTVLKRELARDADGNTVVLVTVKNTGSVKAELAEVAVNFYDAQKDLIDTSRDSVMGLNPGETWDFQIPCESSRCDEIKTFEVKTTAGASYGGF